ncbi:Transducin/WD40 repeat-like superfamily protein [Cinnamomum micranthum f. kanehirae]|uniref:Transducin/WD40 repeat-like superfamily protein n=1 Tax=Cinnamomum micranthum f. kanehirae TaxID=337451 RepID=A0A3S3MLN9_9MAGN|nr:Transducin/WD40 repeat-like superfamily protein [Cinnamomum micranthum f. kanehirae]
MDLKEERKTGKMRGRRRNMKTGSFCIPKLRGNRASPSALLERFRDVVFRLIMLSTISKTQQSGSSCGGKASRGYPPDSHYSEAVADCIEFIKKSACEEGGRDSVASSSAASAMGLPALPVM